jgi:hypothetical protein
VPRRGGFGLGTGSAGSAASQDAANAPQRSNSPHSGFASSGRGRAGGSSGVGGWRGFLGMQDTRVAQVPAQACRVEPREGRRVAKPTPLSGGGGTQTVLAARPAPRRLARLRPDAAQL